jgi:RimJ/RimL family protein N-acetyltransferase
MQDAASMMFIAYVDEDQPVGLVRFALQNHSATVSVSIAAEFRGRGVGSRVISKACQALFAAHPVTKIHAYIKPDNIASRKVFAKAGFMREPDVPYQGTTAVMMTIEREKTALLAN